MYWKTVLKWKIVLQNNQFACVGTLRLIGTTMSASPHPEKEKDEQKLLGESHVQCKSNFITSSTVPPPHPHTTVKSQSLSTMHDHFCDTMLRASTVHMHRKES